MWTPQLILGGLLFAVEVILILFGITLVFVAAFYFLRVVISSLRGKPFVAIQKRAAAAMQAGNLAWMAVICGPLVALFGAMATIPMLIREPGFGFIAIILDLLLFTGLGVLAGIIAGGAFWTSSILLGRVRKTVKKWSRRGDWDPDLDGLA
jgi:hypothetical protein